MAETECGNDAAAYALGALEPAEAEAFERHLEGCAICRDEISAYALVTDALPLAAQQHRPPRALRRRVMREVGRETRIARAAAPARAQRRLVAGFAVVAVAAALTIGLTLGSGGGTKVIGASVGAAKLELNDGHGQLVVAHLRDRRQAGIYELWIQHGASAPSPSTLFSVDSHGGADVGVPGSLHGVSHLLVTEEPAGGSAAPTTQPVVVASLS